MIWTSRTARATPEGMALEHLESRVLLGGDPFPALAALENPAHTVVRLETTRGAIDIELLDDVAPSTVANFLRYVRDGDFEESFFHRLVQGFVLQGGGFRFREPGPVAQLPQDPPIINEPVRSNVARTVAMAKLGGNPNSATSQFFFNLADNGGTPPNGLDFQNGGFTVFARVVDDRSWNVVLDIANMPSVNLASTAGFNNQFAGNFQSVPVNGFVPGDGVQRSELINIWDMEVIKPANTEIFYTERFFYPEGFAGSTINEFLPIGNPNSTPANFQVVVRSEVPQDSQFLVLRGATGLLRITTPEGSAITVNALSDAAQLQNSLEQLSSVGAGNVEVTGPVGNFRIRHIGALAGRTPTFGLDPTNLTGGTGTPQIFQWFRDRVIFTGLIGASSRGGITISQFGANGQPSLEDLLPQGVPYAIEVHATHPLSVNLSHYDFGTSTGESFTRTGATTWSFGEGQKNSSLGTIFDFLVWENPNPTTANIGITFFFENQTPQTINVTTEMFRRGGLNINEVGILPNGFFGVQVTSDVPIIAALTHFNASGDQAGATELGVAGSPSTLGVLPLASDGGDSAQTISFLNPNNVAAVVSITLTFNTGADQLIPAALIIPPNSRGTFDFDTVASVQDGRRFSARYSSGSTPVFAHATHSQFGDDVSNPVGTQAATLWDFAEGFMDPARAGVDVRETVSVFNPHFSAFGVPSQTAPSTLRVFYTDGFVMDIHFTLAAGQRRDIDLHANTEILNQGSLNGRFFYSLEVISQIPVVAQMWHYDLTLGGLQPSGGFGTLGTPFGTVVRLDNLDG
ncbi:MAG TPA: peptidylprolyl isomerase [Phycisphaerales bacterium]|nr:peptidylprolyl isomerase [Phycisphaerales bacterium]